MGYDGVGDVGIFTHSFLSFFDFTIPFYLTRGEWVLSLEDKYIPYDEEGKIIRKS
jgi:hypothetical protein